MKLTRPLVYLDVEATGLDVARDRIVELAMIRTYPDGTNVPFLYRFNPGLEMGPEVIEVHGITNEELASEPEFKKRVPEILQVLDDCDLAGFGIWNFDIQILWEEIYRATQGETDFDPRVTGAHVIDVGNIFKKLEERSLEAAVRFYCGYPHDSAHSAMGDVKATICVLEHMRRRWDLMVSEVSLKMDFLAVDRYAVLRHMTAPQLAEFSKMDTRVDLAGKVQLDKDGDPCYNFGKERFNHRARTGTKIKDDPGLAEWALSKDFPTQTRIVLQRILREIYEQEQQPQPLLFANED